MAWILPFCGAIVGRSGTREKQQRSQVWNISSSRFLPKQSHVTLIPAVSFSTTTFSTKASAHQFNKHAGEAERKTTMRSLKRGTDTSCANGSATRDTTRRY